MRSLLYRRKVRAKRRCIPRPVGGIKQARPLMLRGGKEGHRRGLVMSVQRYSSTQGLSVTGSSRMAFGDVLELLEAVDDG